jgi:hypothetical protein
MYTHLSAAGPAAASTGTGGAACEKKFREWECAQLTEVPHLTLKKRNEQPKTLPKDPKVKDISRSWKSSENWVLYWYFKLPGKGAPRAVCRKEPFWCYDPVKYKELLEKFESESGEAGNAASGTGGAGSSAASGTGAGEYMRGGTFDPEPQMQEPLAPATGAAGSTAASIARPVAGDALAVPHANTLYDTLRGEGKLPNLQDATDHGPEKNRIEGRFYFIRGTPDKGFQLYIDRTALKPFSPRGWTRPPSIYKWNPEAK